MLAADDLEATVFRPSVIFGPEDRFLNLFARLAALFPVLALARRTRASSRSTSATWCRRCSPRWTDRDAAGKRYDLCGPQECTLRELVRIRLRASPGAGA